MLADPLPSPYGALLFHPLAPWLRRLPAGPDAEAVERLAATAGLSTHSGRSLSFVAPRDDGLAYEQRIWERGEVETRRNNWHDFFNALVWLAFPRAKAALNARHVQEMASAGQGRGRARDAMTHFDECGLVVVAHNPVLLDLMRNFQWKALFWEHRDEVRKDMAFFIFGHATYEQLLAPFRGLTAKAVLREVGAGWLESPADWQLADLDGWLAAGFAAGRHGSPQELQPVPLLGIPGLTPDSETAGYYDDAWQFRPGRRVKGV